MKIYKALITSLANEKNPERLYSPGSFVRDFDVFPFLEEGFIPFVMPQVPLNEEYAKKAIEAVDVLVLSGGHDVDPILYGEEVKYSNVERNSLRDQTELLLIKQAIAAKKPILGICRGLQILNVYFGGSLYQNIKEDLHTTNLHMQNEVFTLSHKVSIEKGSFLDKSLEQDVILVNSFHNQAPNVPGKELKIVAKSSDGVIEAMEHETLPIYAVQWHPEISYKFDENSKKLFKFFKSVVEKS